jgi:hypothetical protein
MIKLGSMWWFYKALLQKALREMNSTSSSDGKTKMMCHKHIFQRLLNIDGLLPPWMASPSASVTPYSGCSYTSLLNYCVLASLASSAYSFQLVNTSASKRSLLEHVSCWYIVAQTVRSMLVSNFTFLAGNLQQISSDSLLSCAPVPGVKREYNIFPPRCSWSFPK